MLPVALRDPDLTGPFAAVSQLSNSGGDSQCAFLSSISLTHEDIVASITHRLE